MKKLVLMALTLVAFNANAAFTNSQAVEIPKLSCLKNQDKSFGRGIGGSAYQVDWSDDFCENVSAFFGKGTEVIRNSDGSLKKVISRGSIRFHKALRFQILTKKGWRRVAVQPGAYRSAIDGAFRNADGRNVIDVKPSNRSYTLQLAFNGRNEHAVMGWLRVSFMVDGRLKHYYFDCNTATMAHAMARPSILKRK